VFNGSTNLAEGKSIKSPSPKLFSTTCSKLKFNSSKKRENECRLASGYFIVHEQQLFQSPHSKKIEDFGVKLA